MANYVLCYIRDRKETLFPVKSLLQAVQLADCIATSDLLNEDIDFSVFDLCHYENGSVGDSWESEEGQSFDELWHTLLYS